MYLNINLKNKYTNGIRPNVITINNVVKNCSFFLNQFLKYCFINFLTQQLI